MFIFLDWVINQKDIASGQTNNCYLVQKLPVLWPTVILRKADILSRQKLCMNQCCWGWQMHGWSHHWLYLFSFFIKKNHSEDKDGKEITNWSAGGCLQPRAKEWTAILLGVLGTAAALSHYSALPQRSDGGWDGAEPHTGHRGCNKSQMCWGDMKIHGQAPPAFKYECAYMYAHAHTHREGGGMWRMSVLKRKELLFVMFICVNSWNKSRRLQLLIFTFCSVRQK